MTSERADTEISPTSVAPRRSRLPAPLDRVNAPVLVQFVKFGIVGVSNTLLTLAVYTVLLKVFGVWYLAASAIGFAVGATNGFLLNRRWTFREHVGDALTPVRWGIVQSGGLAVNEGLLYVFVHDAHLDKLARAGVRDGRRHRHHVLRQPRLDVPRAHPGGRRRAATVTVPQHGTGWCRDMAPSVAAQRKTASSDNPAGMRPPRAISAASSASGRSSSQLTGRGGTHRSRLDSVVLALLTRSSTRSTIAGGQQQRVEVGRAHLGPAGLLGDALQRAAGVAAVVMVDLVVAAPQPLVGGHGDQQRAAGGDHAAQLAQRGRGRPRGARSRRG